MAIEEKQRDVMGCDITIQLKENGVRRIITGVLGSYRLVGPSVQHSDHWGLRYVRGLLDGEWSLVGFLCGLLLAALYGALALFLQNQPIWFCVYTTVAVAFVTSFTMGLSSGVRADVTILLPSLFSGHGRHFLLFLFSLVLLSGPIDNALANTERAGASVLCGAEVAANQTQELMRRGTVPLLSALEKIEAISANAYAMMHRVHRLISALTDGVRHVARILRNVLHFMVRIGDVCNEKMGAPYKKCRAVFIKGHSDCVRELGDSSFLCEVIPAFMPLCEIARVSELFCIIPSTIAQHLKKHISERVVKAFEKMKREFEFNISTTAIFDMDVNVSRSMEEMKQDIMEEVSSELHMLQKLSDPLKYLGLVLLAFSFYRAAKYRRRYLSDLGHDNIYLTSQFEELDRQLAEDGISVLPLTSREAKAYVTPLSWTWSRREQRAVLLSVVTVFKYMVLGSVLVTLDFLIFWILDQVRHQLTGDIVARAPVRISVQVDGSGFAADIFRDLVSSFNILQGGNITVISTKCLLRPKEPNFYDCVILGFLLGLALLASLTGGFVQRSRRLICASYYPERERERIQFLRQQILDLRKVEGVALRRSAVRSLADRGGAAGREGWRLPQDLLLRFPGGASLSRLLCVTSPVTCLSCGEDLTTDPRDRVTCNVPNCPGLFCRPCFHSLGNTCVACARPLTFQEDNEEELDSSDDEQLSLWVAALKSRNLADPQARTLMERRIAAAACRGTDPGHSGLSEPDQTYQDETTDDESDSGESLCSLSPRTNQDQVLVSVMVHSPSSPQPLQHIVRPPPGPRPDP